MNFIVYLHSRHEVCNGGINVQLDLARRLSDSGYETKVYMHGDTTENLIYNKFGSIEDVNDDTIAIYCNAIAGNPLKAKTVVRWILYGAYNYKTDFNDDEIVYYYLPFCKNNIIKQTLFFSYVPPGIENRNQYRNKESCFAIRKGIFYKKNKDRNLNNYFGFNKQQSLVRGLKRKPTDITFIDHIRSHEELINIFNTTKYFFCYDPCTFLVIMALMCGCIVIQDPVDGYTESEWMYATVGTDLRFKGLAYGIENLQYAKNTIHEAKSVCDILINRNNVNSFISDLVNKSYVIKPCYDYNNSKYSFQHVHQ